MPQDLHRFGMIPELLGRIPVIPLLLVSLVRKSLMSILTDPRMLLSSSTSVCLSLRSRLEFTEDSLRDCQKALARGTGAHGLRAICESALQRETMFDLPSDLDTDLWLLQKVLAEITLEIIRGKEITRIAIKRSRKASFCVINCRHQVCCMTQ